MIYLSAGHHNADPGAVANGFKEADLTKELRDLIVVELTAANQKFILDKDWETNSQYQSRIKPGTGSVLLDLHFNAATPSATGTEVFVSNNANANSQAFAKELADVTAHVMGITNRGVKREIQTRHKRLGILHKGAGVAALAEVCFITNAKEMEKYQCAKKQLAKEYAKILIKYENLIP